MSRRVQLMIEILELDKTYAANEAALREVVAKERPEALIEGIKVTASNDAWLVRIKTAEGGDLPPFMKKKEEGDAPEGAPEEEAAEAPEDEASEDASEDSDDKKEKGSESDGVMDKSEKADLVGELKDLIDQATQLFTDLGGKAEELAADAQAKDDKINDINDSIQEHVKSDGGEGAGLPGLEGPGGPGAGGPPAPMPGNIGPTPGGGKKPAGPPKRPGVPSGKAAPRGVPGGGIPTFTKRKTEVIRHPGVNPQGEAISILAAVEEIKTDAAFEAYEVTGFTTNPDGTYSAKLTLKA